VAAQLEHTDKSSEPGCLSFKDLADVLSEQKSVPSLAQLDELIDRTKIGAEEVQPYLGFKAGNYSRHRVMKNEFVEMLVLCWKPGQRTPIHDHNGSHGAVFVHEGILWETMFDYDTETGLNYRSHRELHVKAARGIIMANEITADLNLACSRLPGSSSTKSPFGCVRCESDSFIFRFVGKAGLAPRLALTPSWATPCSECASGIG
jgi:hypothetical protein